MPLKKLIMSFAIVLTEPQLAMRCVGKGEIT